MQYLLLIRHSESQIESDVPAKNWHLTTDGRLRCKDIAKKVAAYSPQKIITSREPKAVETGQLIANALQLSCSIAENLHEHERDLVPFTSQDQFASSLKHLFEQPNQLVIGNETAEQAFARFDAAVLKIISENSGSIAIVAHGTVISLYAAKHANIEAYSLWRRLGMPAMLVFSLPKLELVEIIENVVS